MIKSTWYDRRWILSLQTKIRTRPYDDNLSLHVSFYVCKTMFRLCKNWNKSPDLVLYLITLKWSYANNLQVFQHLNIHMWVYNRLSPYNLLRLICFISPKRSSESVFFFLCVCLLWWNQFVWWRDGVLFYFFEIFFLYFVCSLVLGFFFNLSSLGGLLLH